MPVVKYIGPADVLRVGGKEYKQGDSVNMTLGQIRLLMSTGHTFEEVRSTKVSEGKESNKDDAKDDE